MKTIKANKEFTFAVLFSAALAAITIYNAVTFGTHNPL
jgi:hypothetical protein